MNEHPRLKIYIPAHSSELNAIFVCIVLGNSNKINKIKLLEVIHHLQIQRSY
jgi:hypothetical protein